MAELLWNEDEGGELSRAVLHRLRDIFASGVLSSGKTPRDDILTLAHAIVAQEEPLYSIVTEGGYDQVRQLEQMGVTEMLQLYLSISTIADMLKFLSTILYRVSIERLEIEVTSEKGGA